MKVVFYTAAFGRYKTIKPPKVRIDADFVAFTEHKGIATSGFTQVHFVKPPNSNSVRSARFYKMNPHLFFKDYDVSIWHDSRFSLITTDLSPIFNSFNGTNMVIARHPSSVKGSYHEGVRCKISRKDDVGVIDKQLKRYKKDGLPEDTGMVMTGILCRKHNEDDVIKFNEMWWNEILIGSFRDQLSFPYVVYKLDFKYSLMKTRDMLRCISR